MTSDLRKELIEKLKAAKANHVLVLTVKMVPPLDQFETCTVSVEQWLSSTDTDGYFGETRVERWEALLQACALAYPGVNAQNGLRIEPRIGFDPAGDQPIFIFKADNNGTTFVVSARPVSGLSDELDDVVL